MTVMPVVWKDKEGKKMDSVWDEGEKNYYESTLDYFKKDIEGLKNVTVTGKQDINRIVISFYVSPNDLEIDTLQERAYGIHPDKYIGITMTWFMRQGSENKLPKVDVFQFGSIEGNNKDFTKEKKKIYASHTYCKPN